MANSYILRVTVMRWRLYICKKLHLKGNGDEAEGIHLASSLMNIFPAGINMYAKSQHTSVLLYPGYTDLVVSDMAVLEFRWLYTLENLAKVRLGPVRFLVNLSNTTKRVVSCEINIQKYIDIQKYWPCQYIRL